LISGLIHLLKNNKIMTKKYITHQCGIYEIQKNEDIPNSIESMSQTFLSLLSHKRYSQYEVVKLYNHTYFGSSIKRKDWNTLDTFESALKALKQNVSLSERILMRLKDLSFAAATAGEIVYTLTGTEILPMLKLTDEDGYLYVRNIDAFKDGSNLVNNLITTFNLDETCQVYESYDDALTGLLSKLGDK